jgi:hypothetical protein
MHFMNPQRGRHMHGNDDHHSNAAEHKPHIHIHSHESGHTVHVMHHDGTHEKFEHEHGDAEGMAEHVHNYLGGEQRPEDKGGEENSDGQSGQF